jgi:predicted lactoylglutathione lyase
MTAALPPQPNFLTLACADVERMTRFLRDLGWPEAPESDEHHRVFQCTNGVVVALYAAANYEATLGARADGFRGFTLGVNVAAPEEVDAVHGRLREIDGAELLEEPFDSPHGFRGFSFRDPEGNIWDVAWKRGSVVTADGDLTW